MTGKALLNEITQAIVALVVLVPSMLIILYQTVNNKAIALPDVLAGFDGVVITFYFARAGITQVAQAVTNGALQGITAGQANAAIPQPPAK